MEFISPKTDLAFKRIFGSQDSKDILISFLNAMIYEGRPEITDLDIIDPDNLNGAKDSYLDVKAILSNGTIVLMEIQVLCVPCFRDRVLYDLARTYGNQLQNGPAYARLKPAISLTIVDFPLFPQLEQQIITRFSLQEETSSVDYFEEKIELIFVELHKFKKSLEELQNLTEKWIYFIKETPNLEMIPSSLKEVPEIGKALNIANCANFSRKEQEQLEKKERWLFDQQNDLVEARAEAYAQGFKEGRTQALILRQLQRRFGDISEAPIAQMQQLSLDDLYELGVAISDWTSLDDLSRWLSDK
ncbi:Rpn family recombination-promoting nuclease/putative transposase [Roseofilum casamattae]|uniref:Rpn family recombination-promoting nuclease/putative transposase n=1 Tax=Roseofilum casamattae BLCC-M143 TaxID=3022442 RepID=A0ABT7C012_9CYAN|nr:Rpn family recombination-promoting nuclease/putative transposase [Roseofilum casamattae]MDJ1184799.1 Rpn family recombination-promoting nuclease/putative transposase [Roseofilum casamattae BLCC-M143]